MEEERLGVNVGLDVGERTLSRGTVYGASINRHFFDNEKTQHFSDLWHKMGKELGVTDKEQVALWYVCRLLRVLNEKRVSLENLEPVRLQLPQVRDKMVAVHTKKHFRPLDVTLFWEAVFLAFPRYHLEADQDFIRKSYGEKAIRVFLHHLDSLEAPLLHRLNLMLRRLAPPHTPSKA